MLEAADSWGNERRRIMESILHSHFVVSGVINSTHPTSWWNPDYDNAFLASMNIAPVIAERRLLG